MIECTFEAQAEQSSSFPTQLHFGGFKGNLELFYQECTYFRLNHKEAASFCRSRLYRRQF